MLNAERATTPVVLWDGDLLNFATRASHADCDVAGMVVVCDGHARAWINLEHVLPANAWPVWLRLRHAASIRPCAILYAEDLAALVVDDEQQASST